MAEVAFFAQVLLEHEFVVAFEETRRVEHEHNFFCGMGCHGAHQPRCRAGTCLLNLFLIGTESNRAEKLHLRFLKLWGE